jgi:hypothetical protein
MDTETAVTSQWKTNQSCKTTIWHHRKGKWVQRCHKNSAFSLTYILGAKCLEIAHAACRGGGDLPRAFEHIRHETGTYFYVTAPQVVGSNLKQWSVMRRESSWICPTSRDTCTWALFSSVYQLIRYRPWGRWFIWIISRRFININRQIVRCLWMKNWKWF